jgi:hypothetical protein
MAGYSSLRHHLNSDLQFFIVYLYIRKTCIIDPIFQLIICRICRNTRLFCLTSIRSFISMICFRLLIGTPKSSILEKTCFSPSVKVIPYFSPSILKFSYELLFLSGQKKHHPLPTLNVAKSDSGNLVWTVEEGVSTGNVRYFGCRSHYKEGKQRNATSHIAVISVDPDFFYFYFSHSFCFLIDININIIIASNFLWSSVSIYNQNSSLINRIC